MTSVARIFTALRKMRRAQRSPPLYRLLIPKDMHFLIARLNRVNVAAQLHIPAHALIVNVASQVLGDVAGLPDNLLGVIRTPAGPSHGRYGVKENLPTS